MIDQDWRRRLKVLAERLDTPIPSRECEYALEKFQEAKNPVFISHSPEPQRIYVSDNSSNNEDLVDRIAEKAFDTAILGAVLFKK